MLKKPVPKWVAENLGRSVVLVNQVEGYPPGHRALLAGIDAGIDTSSTGAWRGRSEAYALLMCNDEDRSDLSNAGFEDIRPVA